jgi:hypothetical protein
MHHSHRRKQGNPIFIVKNLDVKIDFLLKFHTMETAFMKLRIPSSPIYRCENKNSYEIMNLQTPRDGSL